MKIKAGLTPFPRVREMENRAECGKVAFQRSLPITNLISTRLWEGGRARSFFSVNSYRRYNGRGRRGRRRLDRREEREKGEEGAEWLLFVTFIVPEDHNLDGQEILCSEGDVYDDLAGCLAGGHDLFYQRRWRKRRAGCNDLLRTR